MALLLSSKFEKELEKQKQSLRIPYLAHQVLESSLNKLKSAKKSRYWTLPETKFPSEIEHYSARHKTHKLIGPRPQLRNSISHKLATELSMKIDTSLNFLDLAINSDPQIKPILTYYSFAQICGVFTRAFFTWKQDRRTHGIKCIHNPKDIAKTEIHLEERGQFPRLATTCFLLSGTPSCFSELISYKESPSTHTGKGESLENFGKVELGSPIKILSIDELLEFDYGHHLNEVKTRHGYHKFSGLPTTSFLLDVIILYVSSSFARYDVLGWKEILEGFTTPYKLHFDNAFDRYKNFTVNALIRNLANPSDKLDKPLDSFSQSPYSHRDTFRFETNPNIKT